MNVEKINEEKNEEKNGKGIIVLYENKDQILNASIDKIAVEIIEKKRDGKKSQSILFTGCSPLAGTTSIAISVAIAMAATGRRTILVDCDLRKAEKYKKLNDNAHIGVANYISQKCDIVNSIDSVIYETNIEGLSYIPCGDSYENPTRILCSEKMVELFSTLCEMYDCVLFDYPSISVVPDARTMFGKTDGIVYVAAIGETTKVQIKDARRLLASYHDYYYGMIINKTPKDVFKRVNKNYDYYMVGKNGLQKFEKAKAYVDYAKGKK